MMLTLHQLYHSRARGLWRQILHDVITRSSSGKADMAATLCVDSVNISEIEKKENQRTIKQRDIVTSQTKVHACIPYHSP